MKLIKRSEIEVNQRPFGRSVQKLLAHKFSKPQESLAMFLSFMPKCQLDYHYHEQTEEIIMFPEGGKIEVNGKLYEMQPWDGVLLQPGDIHGFEGEDKDVYCLALRFPDNGDKISIEKK